MENKLNKIEFKYRDEFGEILSANIEYDADLIREHNVSEPLYLLERFRSFLIFLTFTEHTVDEAINQIATK